MAIPNPNVSQTPPAGDRANAVVTGAFSAATQVSAVFSPMGAFNVAIWGNSGPNGAWTGSVQLERSFDGGTTWIVCGIGGAGQQAIWATGTDVSFAAGEVEFGMSYRLHCTALSAGPINYRLSASGPAAMSISIPTAL
ncbi:MAG TPA: hypothetical protein VKS24_24990 [Bradyrhizobium sp.]|nr:hypothetical protein [Bradyrhizobium sp.]